MDGAGDEGAYLNCPMDKAEYDAFMDALAEADQFTAHEFDAVPYFEGACPPRRWRGADASRCGTGR
jgi:methylenetetrahydrofolate--tRNA-(uracil-5-)-methyltransferase